MLKYFLVALLVFSLGCVGTQQNNGLVMTLQADPPVVLEKGIAQVHADITNTDIKRLENVKVEIFNSGLMSSVNAEECMQAGDLNMLLPGEFRTFSCSFQAPAINQDRVTATLDAKASFNATFSAVQLIGLINESEYNNVVATGGVKVQPQSYTYSDKNIALQVDFSDPPPIIIKQGRKFFVKFTISNIGNGFVNSIEPQDVEILQKPSLDSNEVGNVLQSVNAAGQYEPCRLEQELSPIGREFPSFSCQIVMPTDIPVFANYNFIMNIRYRYEIRDSVSVDVIR